MKPFLVIPTIDGSITADTFASLWHLARADLTFDPRVMAWNQDVVRVRNRAVAEFLKSDCTHLWFVDADVGFAPEIPAALFASGLDFVAATYPKKRILWGQTPPVELASVALQSGEVREVNGLHFKATELVPMGCTLLSRHMLTTLCNMQGPNAIAWYGDRYGGEIHKVPALFNLEMRQRDDGELELLPEDYSFTVHAKRCGFTPWVLMDALCTHTGTMRFDVRKIMGEVVG